jgi:hypothetical protein
MPLQGGSVNHVVDARICNARPEKNVFESVEDSKVPLNLDNISQSVPGPKSLEETF